MKKKATKTTAVVPVTTGDLPAFVKHQSGAGLEGADSSSYAIPFLRVLQNNSPQVLRGDAEYLEDARPGQWWNSVTGSLSDETIFLPCAFQRRFIRWAPRGSSRGFVAELTVADVEGLRASGRLQEEDGRTYVVEEDPGKKSLESFCDRIVDTRNHFGLVLEQDGSVTRVLLTLSSTQIKRSKQLLSKLLAVRVRGPGGEMVTPPTWLNRVKLTTALESNDQGSWYGVRCELDGFCTDEDIYHQAADFHDAIAKDQVRVSHEPPATDGF